MSRRAQENLIAAVLVCVFLGVIYMSLGYGPRARMVPIPVALTGLILTVIQIIWQNLRPAEELHIDLLEVLTRKRRTGPEPAAEDKAASGEAAAAAAPSWSREAIAFGLVLSFTAMVLLVGPVPSIFVFTAGYFVFSRHYPWLRAVLYTAFFTAALYGLFVAVLQVQLYHGVLAPVISRF